jgi:protease-4
VERTKDDPLSGIDLPFDLSDDKISLVDLKEVIRAAKLDEDIDGLFLDLTSVDASFAVLEEVRNELLAFKESGKPVVAYGALMTEKAYYLASVADEVHLAPEGILEFNGLAAEIMYMKGLFDKLGVKPKIFRVGKFKSAVEPFMRNDMSPENREQVSSYLNSIYGKYIADIAKSREMDPSRVREISDSLEVQSVQDAVRLGLCDGALYYDESLLRMKELIGMESSEELGIQRLASYLELISDPESFEPEVIVKDHIAVVVAEGEIAMGRSDDGVVGALDIANTFRALRNDPSVKGIVLRINSPGGSALASDLMWREIDATAQVKPVIASMSGLAASGGYYIAAPCNKIYAHPNTITGSIGVFGILVDISETLEENLGISTHTVSTGGHSTLGSPLSPMSAGDSTIIQNGVNRIYETFTSVVATGRGLDIETVKEIAGGRVWTGSQALQNGLVDELGSFEDALADVKSESGYEGDELVFYPKYEGFWSKIQLDKKVKHAVVGDVDLLELEKKIKSLKRMNGVQVRLPYLLEIN